MFHAVAVAESDGVLGCVAIFADGVEIDRHSERCADFVLTAVAAANRAGFVVEHGHVWLEQGADFVTVGTGAILHHDFAARALADPDFRVRERPVSREDLRAESVGEAFLDYLAAGWDDLVA